MALLYLIPGGNYRNLFIPTPFINLKKSEIINHGPRDQKKIALTFDADMTPKMETGLRSRKKSFYNKKIIKILEENSIPATFFITGLWAETYPNAIKRISQNKLFEIENHSFDHKAFKSPCFHLGKAVNKEDEIVKTQNIIKKLTGRTPEFFRFPGGCFSKKDVDLVHKLGLEAIGWDVLSGDSFLKSNQKIASQIIKNAQNGSIIIMHLNLLDTDTALLFAIKELKNKGFLFVTISQLLNR